MAKFITKKGGSHNIAFGKGKLVKKSPAAGGAAHKPAPAQAAPPVQEVLQGQMIQPGATQQGMAPQQASSESFLLKCQSCGVVGEMEEYIEEFECPNCRGIMRPVSQPPTKIQDITQTQKADITQLLDEALPDMDEFDEFEDNTPTIAISKEQINEYKKNIKVAKPVDVGMFSSGSTSVGIQVPTKSASPSAPIDAAKIRAQQELESRVRRDAEAAERKKVEESILNRQIEDQKKLEEKRRLEDQQRREEELIRKFREEEARKRAEEESQLAAAAGSELSERLAAQAEKLRQEKDEFEKQKVLYEKNKQEQEAYQKVKFEKDELERQSAVNAVKEAQERLRREKDELEKQKRDLDLVSRRIKEEEEVIKLRREKDELERQKKAFEDAEAARKAKLEEEARIKAETLKMEELKKALDGDKAKFEEDKKKLEEDKKKFEEDKKKLDADRKTLEDDRKKLEDDKKKFEEDKKKFEEDKKKAGPSSMAESIAKPSSGEKVVELADKKDEAKKDDVKKDESSDKKDEDKKDSDKKEEDKKDESSDKKEDKKDESSDKKDEDKKDSDKKDEDKKDESSDKKDGDKKKSGVKKSGIPGKGGKYPIGQRPGGVKKKESSEDSKENAEEKKDLPDFLTQTNIMRLQAEKKKKILIIIGIGVALVIIAFYVIVIGGKKMIKGRSASPTPVPTAPAKTPVKTEAAPVAAKPAPAAAVEEKSAPEKTEAASENSSEKTPEELKKASKKAYLELDKKLRKNPASITQINEDMKLLKDFIEEYKNSVNDPTVETAKRRIQALEASKALF